MRLERRELYGSPNGDRWFLARDPETGWVFIRHEANIHSGGQVTDLDLSAFLSRGERNPEHQALLCLIGTLVVNSSPVFAAERDTAVLDEGQRTDAICPARQRP